MKVRCALIAILVFLLIALAVPWWQDFRSPEYKGEPLRHWVQLTSSLPEQSFGRLTPAAEEAVRSIGPAGISYYLSWLDFTPSRLRPVRTRFYRLLFGKGFVDEPDPGERMANGSLLALGILGEQAKTAIPTLSRMVTNPLPGHPYVKFRALASLVNMGPVAVPTYQTFLTNSDPTTRRVAAICVIFSEADSPLRTRLQTMLQDPDPAVRSSASNSLRSVIALH
jgi:hypothetical protein